VYESSVAPPLAEISGSTHINFISFICPERTKTNNSEQNKIVGQDSKATQYALITARINYKPNEKGKGKADDLYRGSMQSKDHRRTALQYPLVHWTLPAATLRRISMKALARYQVILLGE